MTYQYNINHYRPLNTNLPYWKFSTVFLTLLLLNTLTVAFYFYSVTLILLNLILSILFLLLIIGLFRKTQKVPFVEIRNNTLNYFDTENEEIVQVSARDITQISTKLCELRVHTSEKIHIVNLNVIRNEKKRWEIKEKIRTLLTC